MARQHKKKHKKQEKQAGKSKASATEAATSDTARDGVAAQRSPNVVLKRIARFARLEHPGKGDEYTNPERLALGRACTLVCRAWTALGRSILYSIVNGRADTCDQRLWALPDHGNPRLIHPHDRRRIRLARTLANSPDVAAHVDGLSFIDAYIDLAPSRSTGAKYSSDEPPGSRLVNMKEPPAPRRQVPFKLWLDSTYTTRMFRNVAPTLVSLSLEGYGSWIAFSHAVAKEGLALPALRYLHVGQWFPQDASAARTTHRHLVKPINKTLNRLPALETLSLELEYDERKYHNVTRGAIKSEGVAQACWDPPGAQARRLGKRRTS